MTTTAYTTRQHFSMLDFLEDYEFDYSEATVAQLKKVEREALAAGWKP